MTTTVTYAWNQTVSAKVLNSITTGNQQSVSLARYGDSGWKAFFESSNDVWARDMLPNGGFAVANQSQVNFGASAGVQGEVDSITLSNGDTVVFYTDFNAGAGNTVFKLFEAGGATTGLFQANGGAAAEIHPAACALADGGFLITWSEPATNQVRGRIFNTDGTPRTPVLDIEPAASGPSSVAGLVGGGFVLAYQDEGANPADSVMRIRLYDVAGQPEGPTITIDSIGSINSDPKVLALANGGFVVAYTDNGWGTGSTEITARIYDASGAPVSTFIQVNQEAPTLNQGEVTLTLLANGYWVAGWSTDGTNLGHYQVFDSLGGRIGALQTITNVNMLDLAALDEGRVAVGWEATSGDGDGSAIMGRVSELVRETIGDGEDDTATGDELRDYMVGNDGHDSLNGAGGDDSITGDSGNDTIVGGSGQDILSGEEGDDSLDGGSESDWMHGGLGNDVFHVDNVNDIVSEGADEGVDLVFSILNYTLGNHLENLVLEGVGALDGVGNALDNMLVGNTSANVLTGGAGDDQLYGEAGFDTAVFSASPVTAIVTGDVVVVTGADGTDSLQGMERLRLGSAEVAVSSLLSLNQIGSAAGETINGQVAAEGLFGLGGNDTLNGGDGDDVLAGGAGADILNGGGGADTVDYSAAAAAVNAQLNGLKSVNDGDGGTDSFSSIENLTGSAFNDILIGDGGANVLRGGLGADTLLGLAGNDVILGGSGALNTLQGGVGDDVYVLEAADSVVEFAGEGTDTIDARINTYVLANNVENLLFGGTGNFMGTGNALANALTGGLGNDTLRGRGGADVLSGGFSGTDTADYGLAAAAVTVRLDLMKATNDGDGATDTFISIENATGSNFNDVIYGDGANNVLMGAGGSDVLAGFGGDDMLMGGSGGMNNQLFGGTGNDWYVLDAFDSCIEYAGEGVDTVEARVGTYTLGAHVENLLYTGPGKFVGNGNSLDNVLTGGALDDVLRGKGGNDMIYGGDGKDEVQLRGVAADYWILPESNGWRVTDAVAGRDGSTYVESVELLRFIDNTTQHLFDLPKPVVPEPFDKGELVIAPSSEDDAFVLPALPDDQPLILPDAEAAAKVFDEPLVLPQAEDMALPPPGLEAHLSFAGDWILTLDSGGGLPGPHRLAIGDHWLV